MNKYHSVLNITKKKKANPQSDPGPTPGPSGNIPKALIIGVPYFSSCGQSHLNQTEIFNFNGTNKKEIYDLDNIYIVLDYVEILVNIS